MMIGLEFTAATDAQEIVVAEIRAADGLSNLLALRPFDFYRGNREEEGAGEITFAADTGLRDGLFDGKLGEALGEADGRERLDRNEVDGAGHRGLEAFDGKTGQGADAGFAGGELGPVIGLAGAERGDHAHAGDDDDRPAELVAWCCHVFPASYSTGHALFSRPIRL